MTIPNVAIGSVHLATLLPYLSLICVIGFVLTLVPGLVWIERVFLALVQDRVGPNRVGPYGLLQPIADGIKLFFKEDILPEAVDRAIYYLAPALMLIPALAAGAAIPFAQLQVDMGGGHVKPLPMVVGDVNIGILFVLALTSLQVYGIVLAGWASNNKYSLLGGLRSSAQAISYELAMSLAILTAVLLGGSLNLVDVVRSQAGSILDWNVLKFFPLGFIATVIYLIAMVAETNRAPFDLPEAESELVAGFHTEYTSMKFAIFFMGEYASMVTVSAIATVLWFGGWNPIHPALGFIPGFIWFLAKLGVLIIAYIWVRATLPRMRYDALMSFGWKKLLPVALVVLFAAACVDTLRTPEHPTGTPGVQSASVSAGPVGGAK